MIVAGTAIIVKIGARCWRYANIWVRYRVAWSVKTVSGVTGSGVTGSIPRADSPCDGCECRLLASFYPVGENSIGVRRLTRQPTWYVTSFF